MRGCFKTEDGMSNNVPMRAAHSVLAAGIADHSQREKVRAANRRLFFSDFYCHVTLILMLLVYPSLVCRSTRDQ